MPINSLIVEMEDDIIWHSPIRELERSRSYKQMEFFYWNGQVHTGHFRPFLPNIPLMEHCKSYFGIASSALVYIRQGKRQHCFTPHVHAHYEEFPSEELGRAYLFARMWDCDIIKNNIFRTPDGRMGFICTTEVKGIHGYRGLAELDWTRIADEFSEILENTPELLSYLNEHVPHMLDLHRSCLKRYQMWNQSLSW